MTTGPRGLQGAAGSSDSLSSEWILSTASNVNDVSPASGGVKLYKSGSSVVVSFSTTTSSGKNLAAWAVGFREANNNYDTTLTLVHAADNTNYLTVNVSSVTGPYSSGGTTAISVSGTLEIGRAHV